MMKRSTHLLRGFLLTFAFLQTLGGVCAFAQNSPSLVDPFAVLTYKDSAGSCVPQQADNGVAYVAGCCVAPGRRGCTGSANGYALPACLTLDSSLAFDPYGQGLLCTLPAVTTDPALATLGQTGSDMTFYITSDIHFFRRTYNLTDQLTHVKVLNSFGSSGAVWPGGAGIPAGTPVAAPLALLIDGDITTHGLAQDLGAYRMTYERGTVPASIQMPVLFGLGNHETVSDETPQNAKRMFDYLQTRMANTHMDLSSGNYSWDWQGVHFVQMNTWAGDQTSLYAHTSNGLAWLANDLKTYAGNSTRPVMLFEHYLLKNVYPSRVSNATNDDFFPADSNAIDSTGAKTGEGYETFWKIIQNYNVIGMFGGHDHCLGMYNTMLSGLPVTGTLYPDVPGYALPMDNYDDGSGGDTGDGTDNQAGLGNGCSATTINGQSVAQTAVASFLVTHVSAQYLDVAAVSWTGDGSKPYFDTAEGLPGGAAACRKRINSQFIAAPGLVQVTSTATGYRAVAATATPANIPVALQFTSRAGLGGFKFVDACADPTDSGTNHVYFTIDGESALAAGTPYDVAATRAGGIAPAPVVVLLTPLSGVFPASFAHTVTAPPANDTVTVYGPPNTALATAIAYTGSATGWLAVSPVSVKFNAYGMAALTLTYTSPANGFGSSGAVVSATSAATGVVQSVSVSVVQPALTLSLVKSSVWQGGMVALSASLSPGIAGSVVNFSAGGTALGSVPTDATGTASFTYTTVNAGTISIAASAGGVTSASQTLVVGPPVGVNSADALTVLPGHAGTLALALTPFGGYTGTAALTCTSPVSYVTCTLASPTADFGSGSAQNVEATIAVAASVAARTSGERSPAWLASLGLMALMLLPRRRRAALGRLAVAAFFMAGCGSGGGPAKPPIAAPSGAQTISFTVTAAGVPQTANVTLSF
jgi:hypothetical protein